MPSVTDSSNGAVPGSMVDRCASGPEHDLGDRAILQFEMKLPVAPRIEAQCRAQQLVDHSSVCHNDHLMSGVSFGNLSEEGSNPTAEVAQGLFPSMRSMVALPGRPDSARH